MGHRIGIGDLEAPFLEVVAKVELGAADKERALGINDDIHSFGGNKDVAGDRAIDEIHLVLEAGASAADDGHAQGSVGASLSAEERGEAVGGGIRDTAELLIPDLVGKRGR